MRILLIGGAGYIGSYIYDFLVNLDHKVDICDYLKRGNLANVPIKFLYDYHGLSSKIMTNYDVILWFAGHSSVQSANQDRIGAINNNMKNLTDFLQKIPDKKIKFIYASTASLYTGCQIPTKEDSKVVPYENAYDISKFSFDYLAKSYHENIFGLRMGTLSGFSRNIRSELIFNQMMINAKFKGVVNVANKSKMRSILFLSDLATVINLFINKDNVESGFYNCASYSISIGELADKISLYYGANINYLPDSDTYSFAIDTQKIKNLGFINKKTLNDEIDNFDNSIKLNQEYFKLFS
jgi:nucleoside-diphosphate-sugar epimerase